MAGGFESLGLGPELVRAVRDDLGYLLPTDVQDEAIPLILGGGDVMVAAETGSGKTAAFGLPALQIVHDALRGASSDKNKGSSAGPSAGGAASSCATWMISAEDKDAVVAVSPDGLACQSRAPKWAGARATLGVSHGRHFYEAMVEDEGIVRVGWATQAAAYNLGTDRSGYGFGGTGMKSNGGKFDPYGQSFGKGDAIGCLLDLEAGEVAFMKNGVHLGTAFRLQGGNRAVPFFPAVVLKNAQVSFNFGSSSFRYPPAGPFAAVAMAPHNVVVHGAGAGGGQRGSDGLPGEARTPRVTVLAPARDLAEQTFRWIEDFKRYFSSPSIEHALLVGGTDIKACARELRQGCDIVVGTPGRVLDMMEKGALKVSAVRLLILDEADRLLETDSSDPIMKIYGQLPKRGLGDLRLQVCFFSATLHSKEIAQLSESICDRPTWVDLKGRDSVPDTVDHALVRVDPSDTTLLQTARVFAETDGVHEGGARGEEARSEALKQLKPQVLLQLITKLGMDQALVFCRTNVDCDNLEKFLTRAGGGQRFSGKRDSGKENPYSCCVLAGMRSMDQRRANLQAFKDGDVRFLICTDVAARGIDVKGLPFVVNMTLPDMPEHYIHRIGRVGRADCMGLAISIVAAPGNKEKVWYHKNCRNRGRGCTNRQLLSQGGCTLWYDEPVLLESVEARLKHKIPALGPGFSLPEGMGGGPGGYGQPAGANGAAENAERVQHLRPILRELATLEFQAQNNYHHMLSGNF